MVGIVVVSHSRALAGAAVALAEEMLHGRSVRIAVAAGLDETTLGTDAVQIAQAMRTSDDGDGVVVLMDLGSAVLSAELALDLLEDECRSRVLLCPAPLVEGLVVAAVAAAGGASREHVAAEAAAALAGKQSQLAPPTGTPAAARPAEGGPADAEIGDRAGADGDAGIAGVFEVTNPYGLHARPAARLVQEVRTLDARVFLRNLSTAAEPVPAGSLTKVATLGALHGHRVEVRAWGSQAREAVDHVLALAARGFGEPVDAPPPAGVAPAGSASGPAGGSAVPGVPAPEPAAPGPLPASVGVGVGPARLLRPVGSSAASNGAATGAANGADGSAPDPAAQWRRLREALAEVRREVQRVRARTAREVGEPEAEIFDAHLMLLQDSSLLDAARERITAGETADAAWARVVNTAEADVAALPDPYLQARAADVRAVGDQVLQAMAGAGALDLGVDGVLVAGDLTPAQAAALDPARILAVVLGYGSQTSHSTILLRARGIPAVVAAGPQVLRIPDGTPVAVDGGSGEVVVDPDPAVLESYHRRAQALRRRREQALAGARRPAVTRDGTQILVGANAGSTDDARAACDHGADLLGLVRTEFLFLGRAQAPDVDEQEAAYLAIAEAVGGRRVTLRTLDVGGDKPLEYLRVPREANPFLGTRGIRLSLARPELLAEQLLAIVRVAHATPVSVMFPMVSTVAELQAARAALEGAVAAGGRGTPSGLQVGAMVEVPAAALKAAALSRHVDFLSIGTNDLTQYALAAERGNPGLAALADPLDPGVLALIDAVCRGAAGRALVAVCGELAADERAAGLLVGLGVRELSVTPRAVPEVKAAVSVLDVAASTRLAEQALEQPGPGEVRALLG